MTDHKDVMSGQDAGSHAAHGPANQAVHVGNDNSHSGADNDHGAGAHTTAVHDSPHATHEAHTEHRTAHTGHDGHTGHSEAMFKRPF